MWRNMSEHLFSAQFNGGYLLVRVFLAAVSVMFSKVCIILNVYLNFKYQSQAPLRRSHLCGAVPPFLFHLLMCFLYYSFNPFCIELVCPAFVSRPPLEQNNQKVVFCMAASYFLTSQYSACGELGHLTKLQRH